MSRRVAKSDPAAVLREELGRLGFDRANVDADPPTVEELFTSPDYFDVTTATPTQRAVCRIADGLPLGDLADDPVVREAFRSWTDRTDEPNLRAIRYRPAELLFLAATRCGKTRMAGALAVRVSQTCDLTGLRHGEVPRVPIVSLTRELADEAFGQIVGTVTKQPKLRELLVQEPTKDTILLRHPSGTPIAIMVAAGSKAGRNLIARWLAAVIFDEAPRMLGSESGAVVNLNEQLVAIKDRMRGPIFEIGSPWAPMGPVYDKVQESHGRPSPAIVVVRGKGPWLNPSWWTPERAEALRTSDKPEDRMSYRVNCEADFADPEEGLFSSLELTACTRTDRLTLPPERGHYYVGAIDTATRGNAWTLVVRTRSVRSVDVDGRPLVDADGKPRPVIRDVLVGCWQWQGSKTAPLDPDKVFAEIAEILNPKDPEKPRYNVTQLAADLWSFDAMQSHARRHGLALVLMHLQGEDRTLAYLDAAAKVAMRQVEIPADAVLRSDLLAIRKRTTQQGIGIVEPLSGGGRHCDYAPALVRVLRIGCPEPAKVAETVAEAIERRGIEADEREAARKRNDKNQPWWAQDPFGGRQRGRAGLPKSPI